MTTFKEQHSFSDRLSDSKRVFYKFPDRIPIIVERTTKSNLPPLDKKKYLAPKDMNLGQFVYIIRKRINLPPEKAMFLFINDKLAPCSDTIGKIYNDNSDDDGFLYFYMQGENTFGL